MPTEDNILRQTLLYIQATRLAIHLHQHRAMGEGEKTPSIRLVAEKASNRAKRRWHKCICAIS